MGDNEEKKSLSEAAKQSVWAIVLAAGSGTRFGSLKQFADLGGDSLVARTVKSVIRAGADGVVVVLPEGTLTTETSLNNFLHSSLNSSLNSSLHGFENTSLSTLASLAAVYSIAGGATRAESVRAGLARIDAEADIVVITDAAHALATPAVYRRVIAAVKAGADGAVPGLPLTEVVKAVGPSDGDLVVSGSLARETHRLVQTPHAFRTAALRAVHASAGQAVEDSAMVAGAGGRVVVVDGEITNIHVTTPEELSVARALFPLINFDV